MQCVVALNYKMFKNNPQYVGHAVINGELKRIIVTDTGRITDHFPALVRMTNCLPNSNICFGKITKTLEFLEITREDCLGLIETQKLHTSWNDEVKFYQNVINPLALSWRELHAHMVVFKTDLGFSFCPNFSDFFGERRRDVIKELSEGKVKFSFHFSEYLNLKTQQGMDVIKENSEYFVKLITGVNKDDHQSFYHFDYITSEKKIPLSELTPLDGEVSGSFDLNLNAGKTDFVVLGNTTICGIEAVVPQIPRENFRTEKRFYHEVENIQYRGKAYHVPEVDGYVHLIETVSFEKMIVIPKLLGSNTWNMKD